VKIRPGATFPEVARRFVKPPGCYWQFWRGRWVLRKNPRPSSKPPTPAQQVNRDDLAQLAHALNNVSYWDRVNAEALAINTQYTWRDIMSLAMIGRLAVVEGVLPLMAYPDLDMIGTLPGSLIFRDPGNWLVLPPGAQGQVLTIDAGFPRWRAPPVAGGSGSGGLPLVATLDVTGVQDAAWLTFDPSKQYELVFDALIGTPTIQFGTGSTPTWDTANNYRYRSNFAGTGGFNTSFASNSASGIFLALDLGAGMIGRLLISGATVSGQTSQPNADGNDYLVQSVGRWTGTGPATALRLHQASGVMTSGRAFIYELPKT
jgi:hypothetical protein